MTNWSECITPGALYQLLKPFLNVNNEHYFGPGAYGSAFSLYEAARGNSREYNLAHNQWDWNDLSNPRYLEKNGMKAIIADIKRG